MESEVRGRFRTSLGGRPGEGGGLLGPAGKLAGPGNRLGIVSCRAPQPSLTPSISLGPGLEAAVSLSLISASVT